MPRLPRIDEPGSWHHVTNRGIARRPVFETRADIDPFLDLVGGQVLAGRLEVHAYSVLTTHFHLLLRSPRGELSEGMRRVENAFVRAYNRRRRRDGPIFRGRFMSRPVESESHWGSTLWYIDRNPVAAGLTALSTDYPHGSAWWYARKEGPCWMTRGVVEAFAAAWCGRPAFVPEEYPGRVGGADYAWVDDLVERRLRARDGVPDPLDDLVAAAPSRVRAWMERKARLADRCRVGPVLVTPEGVRAAVSERDLPSVEGVAGATLVETLLTGLFRTASGLSLGETAALLGLSHSKVSRRLWVHRQLVLGHPTYPLFAAEILKAAVDREGGRVPRGIIPLSRMRGLSDIQAPQEAPEVPPRRSCV